MIMAEAQTPANVQAKAGHDPDPSVLTTQASWREAAHAKELQDVKIGYIEKAIAVAHEDLVRFPTDIDKAVGTLRELHEQKLIHIKELYEEKISSIRELNIERFKGVESMRVEQKENAKENLALALSAAKEANAEQNKSNTLANQKMEEGFTKQIDSLKETVNDLKERFIKSEGQNTGAGLPEQGKRITDLEINKGHVQGSGYGRREIWGYIAGAVGLIATLIAIFVSLSKTG